MKALVFGIIAALSAHRSNKGVALDARAAQASTVVELSWYQLAHVQGGDTDVDSPKGNWGIPPVEA